MKVYRPIFDKVLIKPESVTEQMKGSIIIPQQVLDSEPISFGVITAIGHKVEAVQEGERVMFPKGGGLDLTIEDEPYKLIAERDILMID